MTTPFAWPPISSGYFVSGEINSGAENGDCRRKRRDNGDSRRIWRQSHFSATVAVFGDKLSPKSATIVASVDRL